MKSLNGQALADFIKERQFHQVANLKTKPNLLIIYDHDDPVILKYISLKMNYGKDIGVIVEKFRAKTPAEIAEKIRSANLDPKISSIILQLPLSDKTKTDELTNLIAPEKDVEGLSKHSHFDSATATAILWLLTGYDIDLKTKKIALVGHGKLVGAPLYRMLKASDLPVELFYRGSDLTKLKQYDTIITATGVPGLISDSLVAPGTYLIDAGTAVENGRLVGDIADEIYARTDLAAITPRLGGVGPLTIACLFDHVIQAAHQN